MCTGDGQKIQNTWSLKKVKKILKIPRYCNFDWSDAIRKSVICNYFCTNKERIQKIVRHEN